MDRIEAMAEQELEHEEGETAERAAAGEAPVAHDEPLAADAEHSEDEASADTLSPSESEELPAAAQPEEPAGPEKHWYIIHAYSGFEQKVAESLRTRAQAF